MTFAVFAWNVLTMIGWIVMTFGTNINNPFRINSNNCGDPSAFHLAHCSGQTFKLSSTVVYEQVPAKAVSFPSASPPLCV